MKPTRFNAIIWKWETSCYTVKCTDKYVWAEGTTVDEALNNLKKSLALYYDVESSAIEIESFSIIEVPWYARLPRGSVETDKAHCETHVWLLRLPVFGHIYALVLLAIFLFTCYSILCFLLEGKFFIALGGVFALVYLIWLHRRAFKMVDK